MSCDISPLSHETKHCQARTSERARSQAPFDQVTGLQRTKMYRHGRR